MISLTLVCPWYYLYRFKFGKGLGFWRKWQFLYHSCAMSTIKLRFLLNKRMVAYPWIRQYNHPLGDMRKHEYLLVRCNSVLQLQNALFYFLHGGKTFKLPKSLVILFWLKRSRNIILFGRSRLRLTNGNFHNCRKRIFAQKINF